MCMCTRRRFCQGWLSLGMTVTLDKTTSLEQKSCIIYRLGILTSCHWQYKEVPVHKLIQRKKRREKLRKVHKTKIIGAEKTKQETWNEKRNVWPIEGRNVSGGVTWDTAHLWRGRQTEGDEKKEGSGTKKYKRAKEEQSWMNRWKNVDTKRKESKVF